MKFVKLFVIPISILASIYILIYHPDILEIQFMDSVDFPLGTVISWLLILLIPLFFYLILPINCESKLERKIKSILRFLTFSGLFWGIISYLLSGNWNFVFQKEQHFIIWILYTVVNVIFPVIIFIIWGISRLKPVIQKL